MDLVGRSAPHETHRRHEDAKRCPNEETTGEAKKDHGRSTPAHAKENPDGLRETWRGPTKTAVSVNSLNTLPSHVRNVQARLLQHCEGLL